MAAQGKFGEVINEDPEELFEMGEMIGEGSYGLICTCKNVKDDKTYAIKFLETEEDEDNEGLKREIDILKDSSPCAYIVKYYGCYLKASTLMIVMEYCDGGSALDIMAANKSSFDEDTVACLVAQMIQGLIYLHGNKILHRDIKAGNVLLTSDGRCKLADFGVSAKLAHTMQKKVTMVGSPYWMAPEVISLKNKDGYDNKADIWSLGITAIELAEGKPPLYDVAAMRVIFLIPARDPPGLKDPSKWSTEFVDFITFCLNKDPTSRPSSLSLIEHPFVQRGLRLERTELLQDLVEASLPKLELLRQKRKEKDSDDDDDDDDDDEGGTFNSGTVKSGTMLSVNRSSGTWKSGGSYGTTVFNPGTTQLNL